MKKKFIYWENSEEIENMSKDRVILNLSYSEFRKLEDFINWVEWDLKADSKLRLKARYLVNMFEKAEKLEPEWTKI